MKTKHDRVAQPWIQIGGPTEGMVTALAATQDRIVFAGTRVGVFRSTAATGNTLTGWQRLPQSPVGILSLAVSPLFEQDHTLFAGTGNGIWYSNDSGEQWQAAQIPLSSSVVLAIVPSPNYPKDSTLLAGTAEDGIFYSDTRGERWHTRNFGLLDATVFALAFSPAYERDGVIFAGTGTAVYYSYNSGRAWKQIPFPDDAVPVLSLATSSDFFVDNTVFAGTEAQGLFRSLDRGANWQNMNLPASSINALLTLQGNGELLAATDLGVFHATDPSETFDPLLNTGDAICLASIGELSLAGTATHGVWQQEGNEPWKPAGGLAARAMLGLVLSRSFERDLTGWMTGLQEGIWKTQDGGFTWRDLSDNLPAMEVYDLVIHPDCSHNHCLAAATDLGVLISNDGGETWQQVDQLAEELAERVAFSPDGKILAACLEGGRIFISDDLGTTWQINAMPGEAGERLLALALGNFHDLFAGTLDRKGETVSLWQGKFGQWERVHVQPAWANPVVSLWIPANAAARGPWFAAIGRTVLKISDQDGKQVICVDLFDNQVNGETILSLAGAELSGHITLLASGGQRLYQSDGEEAWKLIHDFGNERAIQVSLTPASAAAKTTYALLLGGTSCRGGWE